MTVWWLRIEGQSPTSGEGQAHSIMSSPLWNVKYFQPLSHYLCRGHQLWTYSHSSSMGPGILEKTSCLVVSCCLGFCVFKPQPCCSCFPLRFCSWGSILYLGFVTHKDRNMPCFTLKDSIPTEPIWVSTASSFILTTTPWAGDVVFLFTFTSPNKLSKESPQLLFRMLSKAEV